MSDRGLVSVYKYLLKCVVKFRSSLAPDCSPPAVNVVYCDGHGVCSNVGHMEERELLTRGRVILQNWRVDSFVIETGRGRYGPAQAPVLPQSWFGEACTLSRYGENCPTSCWPGCIRCWTSRIDWMPRRPVVIGAMHSFSPSKLVLVTDFYE